MNKLVKAVAIIITLLVAAIALLTVMTSDGRDERIAARLRPPMRATHGNWHVDAKRERIIALTKGEHGSILILGLEGYSISRFLWNLGDVAYCEKGDNFEVFWTVDRGRPMRLLKAKATSSSTIQLPLEEELIKELMRGTKLTLRITDDQWFPMTEFSLLGFTAATDSIRPLLTYQKKRRSR